MSEMTKPKPKQPTGIAKYIVSKSIRQDPTTKMVVCIYRFAWWKLGYWIELLKMTFTEQVNVIQTMEAQKIIREQVNAKRQPEGKKIDV
jgi:hypothetical protein